MDLVADVYESLIDEAGQVLIGNEVVVERIFISLATGGHVLLEGPPGVAKTTIARLVSNLTDLDYSRIQMMPDLLPSDVTGTNIYREGIEAFEFEQGPIFANIVLADEINRTTPKTQSALLEAMEEEHVTVSSTTEPLPQPFLLIATQNPIETEGTYRLPIAQRDRFQLKLEVGLPDRTDEQQLLKQVKTAPDLEPEDVDPVVSPAAITQVRQAVSEVYLDERIEEYILDLVGATREHPSIEHGASPRATLAFTNGSKAKAAIERRDYVIPADVKALAKSVLGHRIVLDADAEFGGQSDRDLVEEIVTEVETPGSRIDGDESEATTMSDGADSTTE